MAKKKTDQKKKEGDRQALIEARQKTLRKMGEVRRNAALAKLSKKRGGSDSAEAMAEKVAEIRKKAEKIRAVAAKASGRKKKR